MEEPKNLWNDVDHEKYQNHVTISFDSTSESEESLVYMKDIEKRKKVYGICGECKEPVTNLLNRVKTYLQIYLFNVVHCYGITQDPNTKEYIMVLNYCENGDLRNYYLNSPDMNFGTKIFLLLGIARGLLNIHSAGKAHNNLHSKVIEIEKLLYLFIETRRHDDY
ncbi:kinase-like domain-containing protein [Rhizophagus irregularis DAOM 181602=DAOM 197198]|nr:kinase-like domain-containing protein [Rhizophagus irregularis DAOM 181602=DAOM 197198]